MGRTAPEKAPLSRSSLPVAVREAGGPFRITDCPESIPDEAATAVAVRLCFSVNADLFSAPDIDLAMHGLVCCRPEFLPAVDPIM